MCDENIILKTNNKEFIIEHLYTVQGYYTFRIKIKSNEFVGTSSFCMSKETIISIIKMLEDMYKKLKGICEINDYDSDAFIVIKMGSYGHLTISGQIGGSHEDHFMKFIYSSDQTVLIRILQFLKIKL